MAIILSNHLKTGPFVIQPNVYGFQMVAINLWALDLLTFSSVILFRKLVSLAKGLFENYVTQFWFIHDPLLRSHMS